MPPAPKHCKPWAPGDVRRSPTRKASSRISRNDAHWPPAGWLPSSTPATNEDTALALKLLRAWDGRVAADSPAAAVFELLVAELLDRVVSAKAPASARWARGAGSDPLRLETSLVIRRLSHLVHLLEEQPAGWFERSWQDEIAAALAAAVQRLRQRHGSDSAGCAWGRVRPLTLVHTLGIRPSLARVFNIGPLPCGGDAATLAQAAPPSSDPLASPLWIAVLRMSVDVGEWKQSRFAICGGQSGNPLSSHYGDQIGPWESGEGIAIPWEEASVAEATVTTLALEPAGT